MSRRDAFRQSVGLVSRLGGIFMSIKATKSYRAAAKALAEAIDRTARYLVTYDGAIIATFAHEEDAFLLESELADLDRAHGTTSGKCEVLERKTGRRLGGYLLTSGKILVFLRDEKRQARFGRRC